MAKVVKLAQGLLTINEPGRPEEDDRVPDLLVVESLKRFVILTQDSDTASVCAIEELAPFICASEFAIHWHPMPFRRLVESMGDRLR